MWWTCRTSPSRRFCRRIFFRDEARAGRGVVRHDFVDKQLDGAYGLCMAEATPLERTDEVIRSCGNVLVHIYPYRVRGAGDDAKARAPAIAPNAARCGTATLFLLRAGWRSVYTSRLTVWHTGGAHIPPQKLRQPAALRFPAPPGPH